MHHEINPEIKTFNFRDCFILAFLYWVAFICPCELACCFPGLKLDCGCFGARKQSNQSNKRKTKRTSQFCLISFTSCRQSISALVDRSNSYWNSLNLLLAWWFHSWIRCKNSRINSFSCLLILNSVKLCLNSNKAN